MQQSKLLLQEEVGIKETREAIKPVGTLINVGKFAFKKDIAGALTALLPLFNEIQDARDGLGEAWNEEVPDFDQQEIGLITNDFTEITGNPNYGKIGGGIAMILSGVTGENRRLKSENTELKNQIEILRIQAIKK